MSLEQDDIEHRKFIENIEVNNTGWLQNCAPKITVDEAILETMGDQGNSQEREPSQLRVY